MAKDSSEYQREAPVYATKRAEFLGLPGEFLAIVYAMIVTLDTVIGAFYATFVSFGFVFTLRWVLAQFGYEDGAIKYASRYILTHPFTLRWFPDIYEKVARGQRRAGLVPLVPAGTKLRR